MNNPPERIRMGCCRTCGRLSTAKLTLDKLTCACDPDLTGIWDGVTYVTASHLDEALRLMREVVEAEYDANTATLGAPARRSHRIEAMASYLKAYEGREG